MNLHRTRNEHAQDEKWLVEIGTNIKRREKEQKANYSSGRSSIRKKINRTQNLR